MAYCLIGIFDIPHMHLKRGEGRRAFIRLQEEIVKQSNDLTLFAWKLSGNSADVCMDDNCLTLEDLKQGAPENAPFFDFNPKSDLHGVFACSPSHFRLSSRIEPTQLVVYNDDITITSRGVKLTTPLLGSGPFSPFKMPLYCTDGASSELLAIELRLLGGSIYARTNCTQLPQLHQDAKVIPNQDDVFLAHNVRRFRDCAGEMHKHAIRLPESILGRLQRVHVSPGYLWSKKHNAVITSGCRFFVGFANYVSKGALAYEEFAVTLLFGLDHLQRPWFCFSNSDESFEPHSMESRRMYLERVWRPASQHYKTAYLGEVRFFSMTYPTSFNQSQLLGHMHPVRRYYCDRDVFDVEFHSLDRGGSKSKMSSEGDTLPVIKSSGISAVSNSIIEDPIGDIRGYSDPIPRPLDEVDGEDSFGIRGAQFSLRPPSRMRPWGPPPHRPITNGSVVTQISGFTAGEHPGLASLSIQRQDAPANADTSSGITTIAAPRHKRNRPPHHWPQHHQPQSGYAQPRSRSRRSDYDGPAAPRPIVSYSASHRDHPEQHLQTQTIVLRKKSVTR
jgi:hypothetical protein